MIGKGVLISQIKGNKGKSVLQSNEQMKSVIKSINTPPDFDDEFMSNEPLKMRRVGLKCFTPLEINGDVQVQVHVQVILQVQVKVCMWPLEGAKE